MKSKITQNDLMVYFSYKLAKVIKEISSSHVYFVMQQAFGEDLEWAEVESMCKNIIKIGDSKKILEKDTESIEHKLKEN